MIQQSDNITLETIRQNILYMNLRQAIKLLRTFVDSHPYLYYDGDLNTIADDYQRMLSFMEQGYADTQRNDIFVTIWQRLYVFYANVSMSFRIKNDALYRDAATRGASGSFSVDRIKACLEGYVTDIAMLSLETDDGQHTKAIEINRQHAAFMGGLFSHILTSYQWTEQYSDELYQLLSGQTIEQNDVLQVISALTLACMNTFDPNKFAILLAFYKTSQHGIVRQRALVGWVMSLAEELVLYGDLCKQVQKLCNDEAVALEVVELQKQIVFCRNAERDNDKIQKDIMPSLIKNNNLNISRFGVITEKEYDAMQDVFDPDAGDRKMEELEKSFSKMINMQNAGADIYFGGFSQMKKFPFFYNIVNWFCPFSTDHPDIQQAIAPVKDSKMLQHLIGGGPFCDSDKYSFVLAMSSVINRMPANIREMMDNQELVAPGQMSGDMNTEAYKRRMYLQDLYRFFRLFHLHGSLRNPFDKDNYIFLSYAYFEDTIVDDYIVDICVFLMKNKDYEGVEILLPFCYDEDSVKSLTLHGSYMMNVRKEYIGAINYLEQANELQPGNKNVLQMLARACFEAEQFEDAEQYYEQLYNSNPDKKSYALYYCITLTKNNKYAEASSILFKLDYENPNDANVKRVLAWTLMGLDKLEQARKIYDTLVKSDGAVAADWLNSGYCLWFAGDVKNAITVFRQYKAFMKAADKDSDGLPSKDNSDSQSTRNEIVARIMKDDSGLRSEFEKDVNILRNHGITDVDVKLMLDIVNG